MKNKNVFIVLVLLLFILPTVYGLVCDYRPEPYMDVIEDKIEWVCKTDEINCLSYVLYGDRLLQVNPEPETVDEVGVIDKFDVNDGMVKVYFTKKNLRENVNFTFGVQCGDENLEANIRPQYKEPYEIQDTMVYLKERTKFIVLGIFILIALIIIATLLIRAFRR